jgi:hypothetical protein
MADLEDIGPPRADFWDASTTRADLEDLGGLDPRADTQDVGPPPRADAEDTGPTGAGVEDDGLIGRPHRMRWRMRIELH